MRRGKFRFLLMSLLVASGLVFTGGEVPAATFSYELTSATVSAPSPTTSATYYYVFSQNTGSTAIGYIDFEIPVEINVGTPGALPAGGNGYIQVTINGSTGLSGEIYDSGVGDFGTKFGVGDARYRVVKVGIPSNTSSPFTIALALTNQSFSNQRLLSSEQGSILIKAGNGSNTQTFLTLTPAVVDKPPEPLPNISSFSASPNPVVSGQCTTLSWIGTNFSTVSISPATGVTISGNTAKICPTNETDSPISITYTLTATGPGGTYSSTTILTVDPTPPPLVLNISRQTIEKPNAIPPMNITFYFTDGLPACACETLAGDLILDYPCDNALWFPPNSPACSKATDAITNPILVCIPFLDGVDLTCEGGSINCQIVPLTRGDGSATSARCDTMDFTARDTILEVGPNSCTMTIVPYKCTIGGKATTCYASKCL